MGRKNKLQNNYDYDSDYSTAFEDEEFLKQLDEVNRAINETNLFNDFCDYFHETFNLTRTTNFEHLRLLGASFVYRTIINEKRPETLLYVFPDEYSDNNYTPEQMKLEDYYFWEPFLQILGKPLEKAQLIHNLLSS